VHEIFQKALPLPWQYIALPWHYIALPWQYIALIRAEEGEGGEEKGGIPS